MVSVEVAIPNKPMVSVEVAVPNNLNTPTVSVEVAVPNKPTLLWRWLSLITQ